MENEKKAENSAAPKGKVLVLKNYFINPNLAFNLFQWLGTLQLHGKQSRMRTRFLKAIEERKNEVVKTLQDLLMKYGVKDKNDKLVFIDAKGKEITDAKDGTAPFKQKLTDETAYQFEAEEYLMEEYLIDVTSANQEMVNTIKEIILNTTQEFQGTAATLYDDWCSSFEKLS